MKPSQKFTLSCRQTGEAAGRLLDWLRANPSLMGLGHAAVCHDIDHVSARLAPLAAAAESVPVIGLVGAMGAGKTDLLFELLGVRVPTIVGELGQRPIEAAAIRALLPSEDVSGRCAILRFSAGDMPAAPRGFPIRIGLLTVVEVAAIVAQAASRRIGGRSVSARPLAEIDALFADVSDRLSPQAVAGLCERDILDLQTALETSWPDRETLDDLAASRYWDRFREVVGHMTDRDRRHVLSMLWRNDSAFTTLFGKLCQGIDTLGQGVDAYCSSEALLGKDKTSGWITRHPRSIIDAATLATLDRPAGTLLTLMNRYGQAVDLERAVLAALICDLPLHLGASRLNEFSPAEIFDFPTPPIGLATPTDVAAPSGGDAFTLTDAVGAFAQAKSVYLFERACERRDVTSLVVVVNPTLEDDTFAASLGDWVESAQGVTAHARERVRRGLFIAAGHRGRADDEYGIDPESVRALVRDVLGANQEWASAWTPNRPLNDVYWFARTDVGLAGPGSVMALTPIGQPTVTPTQARPADGADVDALIAALTLASEPRLKQLQLNHALADLRRRLRNTVQRHHMSSDPAAMAEWRRGTAVVVQDRLQFIGERRRLAHLQRTLLPNEAELTCALRVALQSGTKRSSASDVWQPDVKSDDGPQASAPAASDEVVLPQADRLADAAVAHWFLAMRRAARSPRTCRMLRIEPQVLHSLIDELQIGAVRCDLAADIAATFAQSRRSRPQNGALSTIATERMVAEVTRLSGYACRIISAYLEVLNNDGGRGPGARSGREATSERDIADGGLGQYAHLALRPRHEIRNGVRLVHPAWDASFIRLVEDNIAFARLLAGRGDKDRELGELLVLFASGPFEVQS